MHSNRKGYKYIVTTKCDLILHEYYIIRRRKSKITRYEKTMLTSFKKGISRIGQKETD